MMLLFVVGLVLLLPTLVQAQACEHYAGPAGSGSACTSESPCTVSTLVNTYKNTQGTVLCLKDGTYDATAGGDLSLPSDFNATATQASQRITIRAENDGQVWINGKAAIRPVDIWGKWALVEGINAYDGTDYAIAIRAQDSIVRRVISFSTGQSASGSMAMHGLRNTLEDCAVFGQGRNLFIHGSPEGYTYNVTRRCWSNELWSEAGAEASAIVWGYGQNGMVLENSIGTWSNPNTNDNYGPIQGFSTDDSRIHGFIGYYDTNALNIATYWGAFFLHSAGGGPPKPPSERTFQEQIMTIVAPDHPDFASAYPWSIGFDNSADGNVVKNIMGVGGLTPINYPGVNWQGSHVSGTSVASVLSQWPGSPSSVWDALPGLCYRYTSQPGDTTSTLTSTPLWPWPMNQRIKDAFARTTWPTTDVEETMERLLGQIPAQCRSDSGPPVATSLVFLQQPTAEFEDTIITPAVTVEVHDQYGAVYTASTVAITVALQEGGAVLGGDTTNNTVSGVATFADLTVNTPGTYHLVATAAGVTGATSAAFVIGAASPVADHLTFTVQPVTTQVATPMASSVVVEIRDQFNTLFSSTANVSLALIENTEGAVLSGPSCSGGTCTVGAVGGVATFASLQVSVVGTYKLQATSSGLTSAQSNDFLITGTPAVADHLLFVVHPSNEQVTVPMSPSIIVRVIDQYNQPYAPSPALNITVAIGTNPATPDGVLSGTTVRATVGSDATFNDLAIDAAAVGYTLTASASGLATIPSSPFTITASAPPTGAALYWPMTEGAGTTLEDTVGTADGLFAGAPQTPAWIAGRIVGSSALRFTGTGLGMHVSDTTYVHAQNAPITVSFWARLVGSIAGEHHGAFNLGPGDDHPNAAGADLDNGSHAIEWHYGDATQATALADITPYLNTWMRVVLTATGPAASPLLGIYVNGQLRGSQESAVVPAAAMTGIWLGGNNPYGSMRNCTCDIQEFRIDAEAWTAAEVAAEYAGTLPPAASTTASPSSLFLWGP